MIDALSSAPLGLILVALYLGGGLTVATVLHRAGHPSATTVSALAAWPVLAPLAFAPPPAAAVASGPLAHRIRACLTALRRTLADPATAGLATGAELAGLERTLLAADARLGLVDRILAESDPDDPALAASATRLIAARGRSAQAIESVLSELEQLRLHAAMLVLSGEADLVRERVDSLLQRAHAIEEVAAISLPA